MKPLFIVCCGMLAATGFGQVESTLTLEQALVLARKNSPTLRAANLDILAAEASVAAAGLWRNPELKIEAEGIGGDMDPYQEGEYTAGIKQEFLRGGKRSAERLFASKSVGISTHTAEEKRIELFVQVRRAFTELLAQQEIGKVRAEQLELGQAFVEVAKRRLEAGAGSQLDVVQAELALEEIVLAQTCCYGDLAAAKARLSSLLGIPVEQLPVLSGSYYDVESIEGLIVNNTHPTLLRFEAEIDRKMAAAERAKAKDVGNLALGAGYKHEAADDAGSFVFSVSMPLAFARQGRAEQAVNLLRADAIREEQAEARRKLQQELDTFRELHKGAVMEASLTRDKLQPKAEEAYALSREGYEAGRYSWFELIAAQQHLAEVRIRHIESLLAVHLIEAELSRFEARGN